MNLSIRTAIYVLVSRFLSRFVILQSFIHSFQLIHNLAIMSRNSPIYGEVGTPLDSATSTTNNNANTNKERDNGDAPDNDIVTVWQGNQPKVSMKSIQQLASAQGHADTMEFQSHVLEYVTEWETVVTKRVDSEWKHVRILGTNRSHYEKKVEALRRKANEKETKGKSTPTVDAEKIDRNEKKLLEAFEIHELEAGKLCVLMEVATLGGWRDLYPLIENVMKWQANRVASENEIYAELLPTLAVLKYTYEEADNNSK